MSDQFDPYREWLGIQPHEHPVDHYRMLGVAQFEQNVELISHAADERMSMIRKFQTGPRGSYTQQILNELSWARVCLLNASDKAAYDAQLKSALHAAQMHAAQIQAAQMQAAQMQAAQMQAAQMQAAQMQAAQMQAAQVQAVQMRPPPVAPPTAPPPSPAEAPQEEEVYDTNVSANTTWIILTLGCVFGVVVIGCAAYVAISQTRKKPPVVAVPNEVEANPSEPVLVVPISQPPSEAEDSTTIMQEATGNVGLPLSTVQLEGDAIQMVHQNGENIINQWTSVDDIAQWEFRLVKPGFFRVEVEYGATGDAVGSEFLVEVGDKSVRFDVLDSGAFTLYKNDYRVIAIPRSGNHTLTIRPMSINGSQLMVLKSIELVPVQR